MSNHMNYYEQALEAMQELDVNRLANVINDARLANDLSLFQQDGKGNTLLHHATNSNVVMNSFLNKVADYDTHVIEDYLNIRNNADMTALEEAVEKRQHKIVKLLAEFYNENDFPLDAQDKRGNTALHRAVMSKDPTLVEILVKNGSDPFVLNKDLKSSVTLAMDKYNVLSPIEAKENQVIMALELNYIDRLDKIKHGEKVINQQKYEEDRAFNFFQRLDKDLNLHFASFNPPEKEILSPRVQEFMNAVSRGEDGPVDQILKGDIDINSRDPVGRTAIMYAVMKQDDAMIDLLISKGANLNMTDKYRNSALHYAADQGDSIMIDKLLKHGAEIDIPNYLNETPLFRAIYKDSGDSIRMLVGAEANLDWKNYSGKTINDVYIANSIEPNPTPLIPPYGENMDSVKNQIKANSQGNITRLTLGQ